MVYLKTFESYLEGGRAPLYHFTFSVNVLKSDEMRNRIPARDKNGEKKIKSNSYTRSSTYSDNSPITTIRIKLDTIPCTTSKRVKSLSFLSKPFACID